VRFPEGTLHGFLTVSSETGSRLGQGHLLQTLDDGSVASRMLLTFDDGSVFDEQVTFTQANVFTMRRYRVVQQGPAFDVDMEGILDRQTGRYRVITRNRESNEVDTLQGPLEMPADVYNGMVVIVAKNLPKETGSTIRIAAFTPEPRLIELAMVPASGPQVLLGDRPQKTTHYVVKAQLGAVLKLFATLTGRDPPDGHVWIVTEDVPAFMRFEGPLAMDGPVWRIDLTAPRWPSTAND
jgi:hypothetical protein